ncbi:hypothetical protein KL950_005059 [Ogataea haglerorum]|nr:hypothetical protein KL950_005059 [Ogataea haglerorum]KAG7753778.1 hypothetical protein KL947_005131 [Ogataea haglerorum]KAG7805137.1 hypothetical protein KL924_005098 [Ogataea haglerorum]
MSDFDMMDIEDRRSSVVSQMARPGQMPPSSLVLIFDTNFLLDHLPIVDGLRGLPVPHQLIIPNQVVRELDGLKSSSSHVSGAARKAIDWIYGFLHNNDQILRVQRLHERLDRGAVQDDAILDACLFFGSENMVVLFSNDKNLCVKALAQGVLTVSYREDMTSQMIADRLVAEFSRVNGDVMELEVSRGDTQVAADNVYSQVHTLAVEAIEHVLREEFGDDFDMIDYDPSKQHSLRDCCYTLRHYSISTFGSYFSSSGINPLKLLKEKHSIAEYSSKPQSQEQLSEFVEFWVIVLEGLYKKRSSEQKAALKMVIDAWRKTAQTA